MLATVSLTILHQVYRQHKMDLVFVLFFSSFAEGGHTSREEADLGILGSRCDQGAQSEVIKKNTTLEKNKKGKEEEVEKGEAMVVYLTC